MSQQINLFDTNHKNLTIIQCNSDVINVDAHGNFTFPLQGAADPCQD
jgi:hypothetical protein